MVGRLDSLASIVHAVKSFDVEGKEIPLRKFIDVTLKPVLILGGAGTALAGLDAFAPRFAVQSVQQLAWVPEYTIFVQHWGIMVCLMGIFMIGAAFVETWRTPILLYGLIEKAFMVFLVATNAGASFAEGFYAPAAMDSAISVWTILYFVARAKT